MRSDVQAVAWRAYWPVALLAVTFLLVVSLFGTYLTARQHVADERAARQRAAICAILANIPGHIPREIAAARTVFARAGHPADCMPVVHPRPKASPAPTVTLSPAPQPTVIVVRPAPAAASTTPKPQPSRPTPTRTPTRRPTASPSPTRTCSLIICR